MEKSAYGHFDEVNDHTRELHTVHFVVHDDSCLGNHDMTTEEEIDCGGHRDGKAGMISGGNVRSSWSRDIGQPGLSNISLEMCTCLNSQCQKDHSRTR